MLIVPTIPPPLVIRCWSKLLPETAAKGCIELGLRKPSVLPGDTVEQNTLMVSQGCSVLKNTDIIKNAVKVHTVLK